MEDDVTYSQKLQQAFTFIFKDPAWISKLAIPAGLSLFNMLIIPIFLVTGYGCRIMKRVIVERQQPTLPEWDDWGGLLKDGVRVYAAGLIYALPAILLMLASVAIFFVSAIHMVDNGSVEPWMPVLWLSMPIGFSLIMLLSIPIQIIGQVAMAHLVAKDRFSAAFQFKELWTIFKANVGGFVLAWLIVYAATMAIVFISQFLMATLVLCVIYPLVIAAGSVYITVVSYALYAQAYVEAVDNSQETIK
jgi:hypothetical protein